MRFIYEPNKPEQNILCGRLQSVLLWLEMKLKNVSEASQRNTFVTFFFPSESSIVAFVFQGFLGFFFTMAAAAWNRLDRSVLLEISQFACPFFHVYCWTFLHLWGTCGYGSRVCGRFDVVFSRITSQNSPLATFNRYVTHTLMKELSQSANQSDDSLCLSVSRCLIQKFDLPIRVH